jgi:hypothetical protein
MVWVCASCGLGLAALVVLGWWLRSAIIGNRLIRGTFERAKAARGQLSPGVPLSDAELEQHVPPSLRRLAPEVVFQSERYEAPALLRASILAKLGRAADLFQFWGRVRWRVSGLRDDVSGDGVVRG